MADPALSVEAVASAPPPQALAAADAEDDSGYGGCDLEAFFTNKEYHLQKHTDYPGIEVECWSLQPTVTAADLTGSSASRARESHRLTLRRA
jgi:hypothetical protein